MELQLIQNKIFEIRGQRVMLDYNLAELYEVETRALKQAVKRNIKRFPPDFMFELTKSEWQELITMCDNLPQNLKFSPALPSICIYRTRGGNALFRIEKSPSYRGEYLYHASIRDTASIRLRLRRTESQTGGIYD